MLLLWHGESVSCRSELPALFAVFFKYHGGRHNRFCSANGLKQLVKGPTREDHLLDFVIFDLQAHMVEILPAISDHNMVLANFDIGIPGR